MAAILAGALVFAGQGGELVFGDDVPDAVYASFGAETQPQPPHRRIGGWLWGVITAVLIAVVSAIAVTLWERWLEGEPTPTATEVRLFTPEDLAQFKTVRRDRGLCNVDSNVNVIREAHRCFGQKKQQPSTETGPDRPPHVTYIYDPCWGYLGTKLHCAGDPWTDEVTVFTVREWAYHPGPPGKNRTWRADAEIPRDIPALFEYRSPLRRPRPRPWAIELSNGWRCIFVSGASFAIAGERANYICSRDEFALPKMRRAG